MLLAVLFAKVRLTITADALETVPTNFALTFGEAICPAGSSFSKLVDVAALYSALFMPALAEVRGSLTPAHFVRVFP